MFKPIEVRVYDDDHLKNDFLGMTRLSIEKFKERPNEWVYNEILGLVEEDGKPAKGTIYIQAKFMQEGTADDNTTPPEKPHPKSGTSNSSQPNQPAQPDQPNQPPQDNSKAKGNLIIRAVHAKNLLKANSTIDPFLRFKMAGVKDFETERKSKTCFPEWNQKLVTKIDMDKKNASSINVQVIDHNTFKNDDLGSFTMDVAECYNKPNTWAVNKVYQVNPPGDIPIEQCGTVYLQAKFLPDGTPDDNSTPPSTDPSPQEDRKVQGLFGTFKFIVKSARGLADKDSFGSGVSDPYVRIVLPDGQKAESKEISNNLNPDWNETLTLTAKLDRNVGKVRVYDKDNLSSDFLGMTRLSIEKFKERPNEWVYNEILGLVEEDGKPAKGTIYIQAKFMEEGTGDDNVIPPQKVHNK